jgi:cyclic 2,3-diphosphoglycerate synthetase
LSVPAVALIDGEHYPDVVAYALQELSDRWCFVGAVFLGGTEKIRSGNLEDEAARLYGVPVIFGEDSARALLEALERWTPQCVVDLSDEPVLGYVERFRLISFALSRNVAYQGSDFRFTPPRFEPFLASPSLSVIGTGKRTGKTAISGYLARLLNDRSSRGKRRGGVIVVAMGRGGPPQPEIIEGGRQALTPRDLLELSRQGRHAASDHFEDAVLSRVTTVGCRRCGGGLAGEVFVSNVLAGAAEAARLKGWLTIFEGSGASLPPVATGARLLVAGAEQPLAQLTGYLGTYRVLISDAVVLAMAEDQARRQVEDKIRAIRELKPEAEVVPVVFRPRPQADVAGARVAVFTTAPAGARESIGRHLEETAGCRVALVSSSLSDRRALRRDLDRAELKDVDVFLTEVKAAAIDLVVEEADLRQVKAVFLDNEPQEAAPARPGDLALLAERLAGLAQQRFRGV